MSYTDEDFDKIGERMTCRGYVCRSHTRDGEGNMLCIHYTTGIGTSPVSLSCTVYPTEKEIEFEIGYFVTPGALTLKTGRCGSFMDDEHFKKMEGFVRRAAMRIEFGG